MWSGGQFTEETTGIKALLRKRAFQAQGSERRLPGSSTAKEAYVSEAPKVRDGTG